MIDRDALMLSRLIDRGTIEPVSRRVVGIHDGCGGEVEELQFSYRPRPYDPTSPEVEETRDRCTRCGLWVIPDPNWTHEKAQ